MSADDTKFPELKTPPASATDDPNVKDAQSAGGLTMNESPKPAECTEVVEMPESKSTNIDDGDKEIEPRTIENENESANIDDDENGNGSIQVATKDKRKKNKSKSKLGRGSGKPTGFEEFFADAPTTATEAKEDSEIYHNSKPVEERIQTAVQRFSARRKFDSQLREVFDRYLVFGGISAGPNMFCGVDDIDAGDLTAAEILSLKNTKFLSEAVLNGEMEVDFDGVLKGFLSSYSSMWFTTEQEPEIKRRVQVIRSFLNYLVHHDVCPEYRDQLLAAKQTCDVGEAQLWLIGECGRYMPGNFNIACSVLFHGWYHDCYIQQLGDRKPSVTDERITTSQNVFRAALASQGTTTMCDLYEKHNEQGRKQPLRKFYTGLEVIGIEYPTEAIREFYQMPMFREFEPTGKLKTRVWRNPACLEEDLTDAERNVPKSKPLEMAEYEFWLEESILAKLFTGLKFEADVHELTFGVFFLDSPNNFRCSFFTFLPNEAMIGWREHEYLPPRDPEDPAQLHAYGEDEVANRS